MPPPGSFAITFDLDQNLFVLAMAGVFGAGGLAIMVYGLLSLRSTEVRPRFLAYARERTLGAVGLDDAALREALVTRRHVQAWGSIIGGVGMMVIVAAWLTASWLARDDFLLVSVLHGWATWLSLMISVMLLSAVGRAFGVHRLRVRSAGQPVYGDLRPRDATGFVPRWYVVAYAVGLALIWMQALVALPLLRARPTTELLGGEMFTLPFGHWIYLAMPATAVLMTVLGVALLRWTMALPTLRFCADMRQSAAIDAAFRREYVLALHFQGAQLLFFLSVAQSVTLMDNVPFANFGWFSLMALPIFIVTAGGYFVVLVKMASLQQAHLAGVRADARVL